MKNEGLVSTELKEYFLLTILFSWLCWLPAALTYIGFNVLAVPNMAWVGLGVHGPLVASIVLTHREGGWRAVRQLLHSGFNLRLGGGWWLAILVVPAILAALALQANVLFNGFQPKPGLLEQPLLILPTFLFMFFLGGSVQEEFGWRGYALPRLLKLWRPLPASLLLGTFWGIWHLPLFYISGTGQYYMPFGIFFLLSPLMSMGFTWVFLRTGRSLFSALLLHTAINTSFSLFPPLEPVVGGNQLTMTYLLIFYAALCLLLLVLDRHSWTKRG